MFGWLKELLDIRYENKKRNTELKIEYQEAEVRLEPALVDEVVCESCETLRQQLAIANSEKAKLLDRLLKEPEKEVVANTQELRPVTPIGARRWNDQRKILEANDRREANLLAEKKKELLNKPTKAEVAEFESELDAVSQNIGESKNA